MGMKRLFFWVDEKNIRCFIFPSVMSNIPKIYNKTKHCDLLYFICVFTSLLGLWLYYKWNIVMLGIVFEPKCWSVSYGCEKWLSRLLPVKQIRFPILTTDGICYVIYVSSEQANFSTTWECKMASASSTSARNLFQDSKTRLSERVQVCWPLLCFSIHLSFAGQY